MRAQDERVAVQPAPPPPEVAAQRDVVPVAPEPAPTLEELAGAKNEEEALDLSDRRREETLKGALHGALVLGVRVVALAGFFCFVVRVAHLILPESWIWLPQARLQRIDQFLLGVVGGMAVRMMPGVFGRDRRPSS